MSKHYKNTEIYKNIKDELLIRFIEHIYEKTTIDIKVNNNNIFYFDNYIFPAYSEEFNIDKIEDIVKNMEKYDFFNSENKEEIIKKSIEDYLFEEDNYDYYQSQYEKEINNFLIEKENYELFYKLYNEKLENKIENPENIYEYEYEKYISYEIIDFFKDEILSKYDLSEISINYKYYIERIMNQNFRVTINDVTKESYNQDLGEIYNFKDDLISLLDFDKNEKGIYKSKLSNDERKEIYEKLIEENEEENFEVGLFRLITSQGIHLYHIKDNENFEKLLNENDQIRNFVENIVKELEETNHYMNTICYLTKMPLKDIVRIYYVHSKRKEINDENNEQFKNNDFLTIKEGEIFGGITAPHIGSCSALCIDTLNNDIIIPIKDIAIQIEDKEDNLLGYTPNEICGFIDKAFNYTQYEITESVNQLNLDFNDKNIIFKSFVGDIHKKEENNQIKNKKPKL